MSVPGTTFLPLCEGAKILDNTFYHPRGLTEPKKLWWAKEISPCLHISGRLTERQIRCAKDSNIKSIVSLYNFKEDGHFGENILPSTCKARNVAERQCKLNYYVVLDDKHQLLNYHAALQKLGLILYHAPPPVLLYCEDSSKICLLVLLYLTKPRSCPGAVNCCPCLSYNDVFQIASRMGFYFTENEYRWLKRDIIGLSKEHFVPYHTPGVVFPWHKYWLPKLVHKNIFIAGQLCRGHLQVAMDAGFKHIVNMRLGKTYKGLLSQEAVTLLNVRDEQLSINIRGRRQSPDYLELNRLDPDYDASFLGKIASENFEMRNEEEFGDKIGYNEEDERKALESLGFKYHHMPIEYGAPFSKEIYDNYKDKLLFICGSGNPVLFHCAAGLRVSFIAVLTAAILDKKDLEWALEKTDSLGFPVTQNSFEDVFDMFRSVLTC